jgi:hypothetical protein
MYIYVSITTNVLFHVFKFKNVGVMDVFTLVKIYTLVYLLQMGFFMFREKFKVVFYRFGEIVFLVLH